MILGLQSLAGLDWWPVVGDWRPVVGETVPGPQPLGVLIWHDERDSDRLM